jgi:hypothetical protein
MISNKEYNNDINLKKFLNIARPQKLLPPNIKDENISIFKEYSFTYF